ncbi:MAG: hypothetical protein H8K04_16610 [Nitrospira sp.]
MWRVRHRARFIRALAGCCVALWLAGSLSVTQGNLSAQWTTPHCPQGQTPNAQHGHSHCVWHCGGIDVQGTSGRGGASVDAPIGRVWNLGADTLLVGMFHAEIVPRGPPLSCRVT